MANGTTFGAIHSNIDLELIQQSVEIEPAEARTDYVDVPGADGSLDFSEAFGLHYKDREIKWTFALYPLTNWSEKRTEVSNALNGKRMQIVLDEDSDYYYEGRVTVEAYKRDEMLHQITVKARVFPYKRDLVETIARHNITTTNKQIVLENGREPVAPKIEITEDTIITLGSTTITLEAGTHEAAGLVLAQGVNVLAVKTVSAATSTVTFTYRKGEL